MLTKNEIRKLARARRRTMSVEARASASRTICAKLLARSDVRQTIATRRPIAVYVASPEEVDLTAFIVDALAQGASLVAPRWNGVSYELVPLTSLGNLVPGPHGILEPPSDSRPPVHATQPSLWLLPGLAFTKSGKRLGYGGGWYDRLLADAEATSVKLGLAFDVQLLDDLPTELHDRLVTDVVSA